MASDAELIEHVAGEARLFDAWLDGALTELAGVPMPGRLGSWLARRAIYQLNHDDRIRLAERFLGDVRAEIHRFRQTCERLPEHVCATLVEAGVGPDAFAALADDRRLETDMGSTTKEEVRALVEETRRRAGLLVLELTRNSAFR